MTKIDPPYKSIGRRTVWMLKPIGEGESGMIGRCEVREVLTRDRRYFIQMASLTRGGPYDYHPVEMTVDGSFRAEFHEKRLRYARPADMLRSIFGRGWD